MKRLAAMFLSFIILILLPAESVLGAESNSQDDYLEGLFQRYESHLEEEYSVYGLTLDSNYSYSVWAEDVEKKNIASHAVLWAAHKLMGKEINTAAYVDALCKILSMMEKGFVQTTDAQASYSVEKSMGEAAVGVAETTINELLGSGFLKEVGNVVKDYQNILELDKIVSQVVESSEEAALVTSYGEIYKKKMVFLSTVADYTDNEVLREAAVDLIQASSLQFLCILENYKEAVATKAFNLGWDLVNPSDMEPFEQFFAKMAEGIPGENIALTLSKMGKYMGLVNIGFKIGGEIANVFAGNTMELFREMRIMEEIGDALSEAILKNADKGLTENSPDVRYDSIFLTVTCGEALTYVRLRGEYCFKESVKDQFEDAGDLDQAFEETTVSLNQYYDSLSRIFPEDGGKVSVWAHTYSYSSQRISGTIGVPEVYISGREDVAQRINESRWMQNIREENEKQLAFSEGTAQLPEGVTFNYDSWVENVFSVSQALSISMWNYNYWGGAHGIHDIISGCFDTVTGNKLTLENLLEEENPSAKEELKILLVEALNEAMNQMTGMTAGADETIENFLEDRENQDDRWSFTDKGFQVFFGVYSMGPYVNGSTRIYVPYSSLDGIFKKEYLPQERSTSTQEGEAVIFNETDVEKSGIALEEMDVFGIREDSSFALTGSQTPLYDLSVVDETGSNGMILYYTSEMDGNDLVWLSDVQVEKEAADRKITVYHTSPSLGEWQVLSRNLIHGNQCQTVQEYP